MPWPGDGTAVGRELRLGRTEENDLVVDLPMVSSRHAKVIWDGSMGQAWIEDTNSANGTAVGQPGRQQGRLAFNMTDTIYLGSQPISGAWLLARLGACPTEPLSFRGDVMTLGRDPESHAVFSASQVSWNHARLYREGRELKIQDLGSSNGTFVNGRPITQPTVVTDGDTIGLGSHTLILDASGELAPGSEQRRATMMEMGGSASGLSPIEAAPAPVSPIAPGTAGLSGWYAGLLGQAVPVAMVAVALGRAGGPAGPEGFGARAAAVDSLLALAAAWFGLASAWVLLGKANSKSEGGFAEELPRLGLAVAACVIQSLLAWLIAAPLAGLQAAWGPSMALMVLGGLGGLAAGFLIVALSPRLVHAAVGIVAALVVMTLIGAVQSPLRPAGGAGVLADVIPSRWTFEGLVLLEAQAHSMKGQTEGPDLAERAFPAARTRSGVSVSVLALSLMIVGLGGAAAFIEWGPGERPSTFRRASAVTAH